MKVHRVSRFWFVLGMIALPAAGQAQAFGINEIGSCAAARGFAVTGSPCQDASAIFWNPAATTSLSGWSVLGGAAMISVKGSFTQDTTFRKYNGDIPTAVVPHVFATYRAPNSRLAYGIGLYVPYGLTSQWTDSFPGRFQAKKAALQTVYVQPNVGWQLNDKWSVGGGPVIGRSSIELVQALDLSQQVAVPGATPVYFSQLGIARRTEFGTANMKGDAMGFGYHIGLFGKPSPNWTMGIRFLSPVEFDYKDADATFTQTATGLVLPPGNPICYPTGTNPICGGNPNATVDVDALVAGQFTTGRLTAQKVNSHITHPAQIQAGFGYTGFANWNLSADYAWVGWKRFRELPVDFQDTTKAPDRTLIEDYNNSSAIRLGAERSFTGGARLRLGFAGVASAAPDETVTPLLPEQDRSYMSIGGGYPVFSGWTIDAAYLRVGAPGKRGRIDERTSRTQTAGQLNSGLFELSANVFTVSLKGSF